MINEEKAIELIEGTFWKFAKTMAWNPHWYCLKENFANPDDFTSLAHFVRDNGVPIKFGKREYIIYKHGEFRYWVMDANPSDAVLINRTFMDDQKRKSVNVQEELDKNEAFKRSKRQAKK